MAAVTPIKIKALTNVIMHCFVNFVRGGGSDKSCFNENKMLYIWVMIQLFLCPREGALKKKTSGICQNAGLTTTHFKPFLNVKILREVFMSYNGQTTVVHVFIMNI